MSREAMQIALDALEANLGNWAAKTKAVEVLRQTLETKREWVGLTDEEIQDLSYLSQKIDDSNSPWFDRWEFARAIETRLQEKNQ
jgi:hypothetical protein